MKNDKINFGDETFRDNVIELVLFSPNSDNVGIVLTSIKNENEHILRIIQLLYSVQDNSYDPIQELASFSFKTYDELKDFIEELPNVSGIDMLLLLNPLAPSSFMQN